MFDLQTTQKFKSLQPAKCSHQVCFLLSQYLHGVFHDDSTLRSPSTSPPKPLLLRRWRIKAARRLDAGCWSHQQPINRVVHSKTTHFRRSIWDENTEKIDTNLGVVFENLWSENVVSIDQFVGNLSGRKDDRPQEQYQSTVYFPVFLAFFMGFYISTRSGDVAVFFGVGILETPAKTTATRQL